LFSRFPGHRGGLPFLLNRERFARCVWFTRKLTERGKAAAKGCPRHAKPLSRLGFVSAHFLYGVLDVCVANCFPDCAHASPRLPRVSQTSRGFHEPPPKLPRQNLPLSNLRVNERPRLLQSPGHHSPQHTALSPRHTP